MMRSIWILCRPNLYLRVLRLEIIGWLCILFLSFMMRCSIYWVGPNNSCLKSSFISDKVGGSRHLPLWLPKRNFTTILEVGGIPLSHYQPSSGVIRMGSQYEGEEVEKFGDQDWLKGLQMIQFECQMHWNPSVWSILEVGRIPISHNWPSRVIRMDSPVWKWKGWKVWGTRLA